MNTFKLSIAFFLCLFMSAQINAQTTYNKIIEKKDGEQHLLGLSNRAGLAQAPFKESFDKNNATYETDKAMLA